MDSKAATLRKARVPENDKEFDALLEQDDLEEVIEHEVRSRRESKSLLQGNGVYKCECNVDIASSLYYDVLQHQHQQ